MGRTSWPRWYHLYFVLAAFDVFAVCAGLYLSHSIMSIYTDSVSVNQTWAERADAFSDLGPLAASVNAPGNDVFDSHDVEAEDARMQAAAKAFDRQFVRLRRELVTNVPPADAAPLLARLDAVGAAVASMAGEEQLIFSFLRTNQPERAGARMATADHRYAAVNSALDDLRHSVALVQQANFAQQTAAAAAKQSYEYLIGALILLMVGGATFYGHRMARQVQADMAEKERHLRELGEAQARLKEHAIELAQSNQLIRETHQRLQALFKRTLEGQEAQRQEIARELHEEIAQMLGILRLRLSSLELTPEMKKRIEPQVADAGTIAESALHRLQDLVRDLTPHGMALVGLAGVLVVHLETWTQDTGLTVRFSEHLSGARPPHDVELAAYRVAQEAVANAVRHAQARNLRVDLFKERGALHLHVEDDGAGFDIQVARRDAASGNRTGITLMEQRTALLGGRLEIVSAPGRGTAVKAVFPASV